VTGPADLSHAVLIRVADFLRGLPADRLAALANGEATLAVVDAAAPVARASQAPTPSPDADRPPRTAPPSPVRLAAALAIPVDELRAALSAFNDRASAVRYLDDLKLTTAHLRALAKELGLAVSSSAGKAAVRDTIVQWTVGRRVDAAVLSRPRV
jgi:hypothetical protein